MRHPTEPLTVSSLLPLLPFEKHVAALSNYRRMKQLETLDHYACRLLYVSCLPGHSGISVRNTRENRAVRQPYSYLHCLDSICYWYRTCYWYSVAWESHPCNKTNPASESPLSPEVAQGLVQRLQIIEPFIIDGF